MKIINPAPLLAALLILFSAGMTTAPARAGDFGYLDWANVTANDSFGDRQDRWQSFSSSTSFLYGPSGTTAAPEGFGRVWEMRLRTQIMTPANTRTPAPGDRRVAGVLSAGFFTHATRGAWDFALGVGVEAVGPGTGLIALQDRFHRLIGADRVAMPVRNAQIGDRVRPMGSAQAAFNATLGDGLRLRPFVEVHGGLESYARVGADLIMGQGFDAGILVRDHVTGQLYQLLDEPASFRVSAVLGGDIARVFSSAYLPGPGFATTPVRARIRGGVKVDFKRASLFYGATYLAPEFVAQPSGQVLGTLQLQFRF